MQEDKLPKAIKDCKAYRKLLKGSGLPENQQVKGYMITKESIERLLAQNGGNIDGIRIYAGLDEATGAIKPYAVACVLENGQYNDWEIPKGNDSGGTSESATRSADATSTSLSFSSQTVVVEEPRPCPHECGTSNGLNTGV